MINEKHPDIYYESMNEESDGESYSESEKKSKAKEKSSKGKKHKPIRRESSEELSTKQKRKVGRKIQFWNEQRQKRYLMFFLENRMKDPRKSYSSRCWKHDGAFPQMQQFMNEAETIKIDEKKLRKQIKSYDQRKQNQWRKRGGQRSKLAIVLEQLFEKYVEKREDEEVIELMTEFQRFMKQESERQNRENAILQKIPDWMERVNEIERQLEKIGKQNEIS